MHVNNKKKIRNTHTLYSNVYTFFGNIEFLHEKKNVALQLNWNFDMELKVYETKKNQ